MSKTLYVLVDLINNHAEWQCFPQTVSCLFYCQSNCRKKSTIQSKDILILGSFSSLMSYFLILVQHDKELDWSRRKPIPINSNHSLAVQRNGRAAWSCSNGLLAWWWTDHTIPPAIAMRTSQFGVLPGRNQKYRVETSKPTTRVNKTSRVSRTWPKLINRIPEVINCHERGENAYNHYNDSCWIHICSPIEAIKIAHIASSIWRSSWNSAVPCWNDLLI